MNSDSLQLHHPPHTMTVPDRELAQVAIPCGLNFFFSFDIGGKARAIYFTNMLEQRERERLN